MRDDNAAYETWLRTQCAVVDADLAYKHERMKKSAFVFLRASYFRWARSITDLCPELKDAPAVLSVGDMHVENFGKWRDDRSRLVWGVNDFDEAATIAYALDLLRLATSVRLSPKPAFQTAMRLPQSSTDMLRASRDRVRSLLDEAETSMRPYVACTDDDRRKFGRRSTPVRSAIPPAAVAAMLEERHSGKRLRTCATPRVLKAAEASADRAISSARRGAAAAWCARRRRWCRRHGAGRAAAPPNPAAFSSSQTENTARPDPSLAVKNGYVLRRVAADARKVELGDSAGAAVSVKLLEAMGLDIDRYTRRRMGQPLASARPRQTSSRLAARSRKSCRCSSRKRLRRVDSQLSDRAYHTRLPGVSASSRRRWQCNSR